jgi:hypothetical protein
MKFITFDHLIEKQMSYWQHFYRAICISASMISGGVKNICHAIYPDIFSTNASDTIAYLYPILFDHEKECNKSQNNILPEIHAKVILDKDQ